MTTGLWAKPIRTHGQSDAVPKVVLRALRAVGIPADVLKNRMAATQLPPLPAVANHGRWLTYCDRCSGAEIVFDDGWFICVSCILDDRGVAWRRVAFPDDRGAIEEALATRLVDHRNWEPGESIDFLLAENRDHGL